uniref:TSA: Wollemia nobilis Ref_Wollemi_Transcript_4879_736 transcribed RNA sequence n=1 Tax=Wollemia nobilis TaxID=56998 RepID=A0A0C9SA51_9CONI
MGLPGEARDLWAAKRRSFVIPSPDENATARIPLSFEEEKAIRAKHCTDEGVREGAKAAAIACVASAIPTLIGVRVIPWAKANLNYTAQALIISASSVAAYFIVAEKTILECSRKNTRDQYEMHGMRSK